MKLNKVGIVGCGFVSKFHVEAWKKVGAEEFVLCDSNPKMFMAHGKLAETTYTDYHSMLENEELDAVSVCTPPFNHAEIAEEALKHGCYVLVEKPFTVTTKEASRFLGEKKVSVVHNELVTSYLFEAWKFVEDGKLGTLYEVNIYLMDPVTDVMTGNLEHWSYKMTGGRIAECLAHPIYYSQCFLGKDDLRVEHVHAERFADRNTFQELRCVLSSGKAQANINVRMNALGSVSDVHAYGARGSLKASLIPQMFHVKHYDGHEETTCKRRAPPSARYLIVKTLLEGKPLFTAEHAFHNIRILNEILEEIL